MILFLVWKRVIIGVPVFAMGWLGSQVLLCRLFSNIIPGFLIVNPFVRAASLLAWAVNRFSFEYFALSNVFGHSVLESFGRYRGPLRTKSIKKKLKYLVYYS